MTDAPEWMQRLSQKARAAAEQDMRSLRERAALAWPTEAAPDPLPFQWGDYDALRGVPVPGAYWNLVGDPIHIRESVKADKTWKAWVFSRDGETWSTTVQRGPIYSSQRDALVARRWATCRRMAAELASLDDAIDRAARGGANG